jgi:peroxiredoxin
MPLLNPGDRFPSLTVPSLGGGSLALPDALRGHFGVILLYRGHWCPYCKAQLRAFQRAQDTLTGLDAKVVALSVEDEATTQALADEHGLTFPLGHSVDADEIAKATGAFVNQDPKYLQSTGFVIDGDGKIIVSVYSSGAIGRLVPEDVAGLIRYLREHAAG